MIKNKAAIAGLIVIVACIVVAVFAYFIAPDSTPNANRMIVEISGQKPGYRQEFIKIPKEQFVAPVSFLQRLAYGIPDRFYYVPVTAHFIRNDSVYIDKYIDEDLSQQDVYALRLFEDSKPEFVEHRFLLGTDKYGRDILSRLIIGVRVSLAVGLVTVLLSVCIGVLLGAVAFRRYCWCLRLRWYWGKGSGRSLLL